MIEFRVASDSLLALSHSPVPLADMLGCHRQRALSRDAAITESGNWQHYDENSLVPSFLARFPTVRFSSFALSYAPDWKQSRTALELEVAADATLQIRGFHIVRPTLKFRLYDQHSAMSNAVIAGRAKAIYTIAGSEERMECCADVRTGSRKNEKQQLIFNAAISM